MKDYNDQEGEFLAEVVAGGYDTVTRTWLVDYKGINYSENLEIQDILESLVRTDPVANTRIGKI